MQEITDQFTLSRYLDGSWSFEDCICGTKEGFGYLSLNDLAKDLEVVDMENKPKMEKTWFGQKSALKFQMAEDKRIFIHVGKKMDEKTWVWKKCKFSSLECVNVLRVLNGVDKGWSSFHSFKSNNGQTTAKIWVNRHDDKVVFKIDELAKQMIPAEANEMAIVLREGIILGATGT